MLWHLNVHLSLFSHPKETQTWICLFSSTFKEFDESWNQLQQNKFYIFILRKQLLINKFYKFYEKKNK